MTFEDGIAYSRNVVAAKVALGLERLDRAESSAMLYDSWRKLGYGGLTGIDVAGEVAGSCATRPPFRGARSTSPMLRSARAWQSRRSSSRPRSRRS